MLAKLQPKVSCGWTIEKGECPYATLQNQASQLDVSNKQQEDRLKKTNEQLEIATKQLGEKKEQLESLEDQCGSLEEQKDQRSHLNVEFYQGQVQPKIRAVADETARKFVDSRKGIWAYALYFAWKAGKSDTSFNHNMERIDLGS